MRIELRLAILGETDPQEPALPVRGPASLHADHHEMTAPPEFWRDTGLTRSRAARDGADGEARWAAARVSAGDVAQYEDSVVVMHVADSLRGVRLQRACRQDPRALP